MKNNTKYFLFGLSLLCVCMIGITTIKGSILNPLRTAVGYVLVPIQSGVNRVGGGLYNELSSVGKLKTALAENETLKTRVDELTEENTRLRSEQFELERLRSLYELDQEYMQYHKIGARIIAKDSGSWFSVFRIDKGSDDGIKEDMNVIAGGGLVGIVTDVGANYATVRSIIDDSSRVSAMAQQSGDSCIVAGDLQLFKEGRLKLSYMEKDDDIKDGDMIVTSNISGKFLPGILVGYATDITVDYNDNLTKSGYLIPAARFDRLQEVLVITDLKDAGPEINEKQYETDHRKLCSGDPGIYRADMYFSAAAVPGGIPKPHGDPGVLLWIYQGKRMGDGIRSDRGTFDGSVIRRSFGVPYTCLYLDGLCKRNLYKILL